jgi:hypothetical protein
LLYFDGGQAPFYLSGCKGNAFIWIGQIFRMFFYRNADFSMRSPRNRNNMTASY